MFPEVGAVPAKALAAEVGRISSPGVVETRMTRPASAHEREADGVQLEIRGHHFPGRTWALDGEPCHNVHVGVQVRQDPSNLVPGDAEEASWLVDIGLADRDGTFDFNGPAVHGKPGERFVYLTWGNVGDNGAFTMFRRAKLMLGHIEPALIRRADAVGQRLVATVDLTDECGGPRCARLRSPALAVTVEPSTRSE